MTLAYVYNKHGEALEYDMFHLWGVDINTVSIRRMWNFFNRLPAFSETVQDMADVPREARTWDANTWMLANVVDACMMTAWRVTAAFSQRAPQPPKPFPRPKTKKFKSPGITTQDKKPVWPGKTIYTPKKE